MRIALLGYGKMGKTIERIATEKGHVILYRITNDLSSYDLTEVDVAIDFSIPEAAFGNITTCFRKGIPVVSGTTGWLQRYEEAREVCLKENSGFIYASNFSLGVNLFFELNRKLAEMMNSFPQYQIAIEETHHTQKLDAPSGTAISLAEQIIENSEKKKNWSLVNPESVEPLGDSDSIEVKDYDLQAKGEANIPITAQRIENVPGTHRVSYSSPVDTINIEHIAHSRDGFALGAVIAAEWLQHKRGVFTMKDVLF